MAVSGLIRKKASELGFNLCGIAQCRPLEECRPVLEEWLNAGMNDKMGYLARNVQKRLDPGLLLRELIDRCHRDELFFGKQAETSRGAGYIEIRLWH